MSYKMFRGAAPITTPEMKPRTVVHAEKSTSSYEYALVIITKVIKRCGQENICALCSGLWVQISVWRSLSMSNASEVFPVSPIPLIVP